MNARKIGYVGFVMMILVMGICLPAIAQNTAAADGVTQRDTLVAILCHMSSQLRLIRPLATYAILSPIRGDQRMYAQYIVNLLEGSQGKDYVPLPVHPDLVKIMKAWGISLGDPGLIEGASMLKREIGSISSDSPLNSSKGRLTYTTENISYLLKTALDEAQASFRARNIDSASDHMRISYACAFAALGVVVEGTSPGSVVDLLIRLKGSAVCHEQQ